MEGWVQANFFRYTPPHWVGLPSLAEAAQDLFLDSDFQGLETGKRRGGEEGKGEGGEGKREEEPQAPEPRREEGRCRRGPEGWWWRERGNDQRREEDSRGRKKCPWSREEQIQGCGFLLLLLGLLKPNQTEASKWPPQSAALPAEGTWGMQPLPPPVPGPLALLDTTG